MTQDRSLPPVWLMGLANATFGMYGGFAFISLPQLLAERGLVEDRIATITATVSTPYFCAFLLGPMLDVRFSRRLYAALFAAIAAMALCVAISNMTHVPVLEAALIVGVTATYLSANALAGWLVSLVPKRDETRLSAWFNVANIGGGGAMVIIAGEVMHRLPLQLAAVVIGALIVLPASIFLWIPAPGPDRRLASESFGQFFREVVALVRRRQVLVALVMFLSPAGSFALTNILGGLGGDFHASPHEVSVVGGLGVTTAGIVGSLAYPLLARRIALRTLYVGIGTVGGVFTLGLSLLPHTPSTFALAMLGEYTFQALILTATLGIAFETVGQNNPLASTGLSVMGAAGNVPITYMMIVDGRAHGRGGIGASYLVDATAGIAACVLLGFFLASLQRRGWLAAAVSVPDQRAG